VLSDILQCNTVLYCYRFVTLHCWLCFQHSLVFHVSSSGRRWTCDVSCGSCSESTFDCVSRGMIFAYGCIVYCVCDADVSVDVLWRSALMTSTRRAATINNLVWQTNRRWVGRGMGRGIPSHPTRGSGERRELPQRVRGGAPPQNEFGAFWYPQEAAGCKDPQSFVA